MADPLTFFAAVAAAGSLASGVSVHAQQKDPVKLAAGAEADKSENRPARSGPADACPEAPAPDDYLFVYCGANVGPQMAEARTMAQAPDGGCALPSETWGIPAALDAAITGPADKDRACMRALLTPDARITIVSLDTAGAPRYKVLSLDDWIDRTKARGHIIIEEKQLNFRVDRFGNIAHVWSMYALRSEGQAVARGINSIHAIKEPGGWRVASILVQAESPAAPLPEDYIP